MYACICKGQWLTTKAQGRKEKYNRFYPRILGCKERKNNRVCPRILGCRSIQHKTTSVWKIINYSNKDTKGKGNRVENTKIKGDKLPCPMANQSHPN